MSDVISLSDIRKDRRPNYVDVVTIEAGCELLETCVSQMVVGSQNEFGGIDPLAHEINAHVVAIRRAMAIADVEACQSKETFGMNPMEARCICAFKQIGSNWVTVLEPVFVHDWLKARVALEHREVKKENGAIVSQYRLKEPSHA